MSDVKGMVLDVVYRDNKHTNLIVKEMDSSNTFYCSIQTKDFNLDIGSVYNFEIEFNAVNKIKEDKDRYFQRVMIKQYYKLEV